MQAIQTRYLGPTNSRGSRIAARCDAGRLTVQYDDELNIEENHKAAARALRDMLGWSSQHYGLLATGALPGGDYAHVFVNNN